MPMEARLTSTFVIDGQALSETEARTYVERLIIASLGGANGALNGRTVKLSVIAQLTTDKPYVPCQQLGYYSDTKCGRLNAPGTACPEVHYHRPQWVERSEPDPDDADITTLTNVCEECERRGIEPSRGTSYGEAYNHSNAGA